MSRPTPFALAIEDFINQTTAKEDKKSVFYIEVLAKVQSRGPSPNAADNSKDWADSLSTFVNDLEKDNRTRSKGRQFVERLGRVSAGFSQYAGAFDVLIQAGDSAAILIYGGAKLLLQLSQKVYECYETIVDILEDISSHIQCFHSFSQAYEASDHVRKQLVKSYKLIINFWLKASKLLTGHALTKIFSRNSQLSREWQKYCGDLHRCKDQVCLAVEAAKADLRREKTQQDRAQAKEQERKDTLNNVANWIRGNENDDKLQPKRVVREKLELRHGRSCDWLLENPEFESWQRSKETTSLLLCSRPGTGKSVMASHVVRTLENQGLKVVSYFFSFQDITQGKAITALRSLALQLLAFYTSVPDSVLRIFAAECKHRGSTLEDTEIMIQLVQALLKQISRVHVVVDGLDECAERRSLLCHLPRLLTAKTHGIVKWLLTSRPEKDIRDRLVPCGTISLDVPKEKLYEDVSEFMADAIRTRLGIDCQSYIEHWVREADGNFMWAHLTLQTLEGEGLTCDAEIDEALEKFPKGLSGCYQRTLQHLVRDRKEAECKLAQNVFKLLVAAVQPLRLSEVSQAIAALSRLDSLSTDEDYNPKREPRQALIETLCSGLVEFDRMSQDGELDPILKFAHKSVRDFFVEDPNELAISGEVARFFVTEEDAQLLLGTACLRYLSFARYQSRQDVESILPMGPHAFLRYAAAFWVHHLSSAAHSQHLYDRILAFARSASFWNCLEVQAYTVPHIFAQYFEMVSGGYNYNVDDTRLDDVVGIAYGSPLPLWLDELTYGREGREMVSKVQVLVQHWHSVLVSHPAAFKYCIMDCAWESHFSRRDGWRCDRVCTYALTTSAEESDAFIEECLDVMSVEQKGPSRKLRVLAGPSAHQTHGLEWHIDAEARSVSVSNTPMQPSAVSTNHGNTSTFVVPYMSSTKPTLLRRDTLTLVASSGDSSDRGEVVHSCPRAVQEPWHVWSTSNSLDRTERGARPVVTILCSSEPPRPERHMQDHDSGFFDDTESDASSVSSDIADDLDVGDYDEETDKDEPTRCMLVVRPDASPIWSFWHQRAGLNDTTCAVSHSRTVAIWTHKESEACVVNLMTGDTKYIYLREPGSWEDCKSPMAEHREFHFSQDESMLFFLRYTAIENDFGIQQRLTVSTLRLSLEGGEPVLTRIGHDRRIDHASGGRLQWPCILRSWTTNYLYVALPCLSCDPKMLRLSLSELLKDSSIAFDTLQEPIFFPSISAERRPKLFAFDGTDEKTQLVLALGSHQPNTLKAALPQPPNVMIWTLDDTEDWRQWDEEADGVSARYKAAEESSHRLRGNFVDPSQRFLVPIRSGLDWTKKAFVACL